MELKMNSYDPVRDLAVYTADVEVEVPGDRTIIRTILIDVKRDSSGNCEVSLAGLSVPAGTDTLALARLGRLLTDLGNQLQVMEVGAAAIPTSYVSKSQADGDEHS